MSQRILGTLILENAQKINQLHEECNKAARTKDIDPDSWQKACGQFQNEYDRLAFPGGLEHGLKLLKEQDPTTIATAIEYLQVNPYCFRSGYVKQKIVTVLKKAALNKKHIAQLQLTLIDTITRKNTMEFREYCRLARAVQDDAFIAKISMLIKESADPLSVKKAERMLKAIQS
jgi:hypothetical protein